MSTRAQGLGSDIFLLALLAGIGFLLWMLYRLVVESRAAKSSQSQRSNAPLTSPWSRPQQQGGPLSGDASRFELQDPDNPHDTRLH